MRPTWVPATRPTCERDGQEEGRESTPYTTYSQPQPNEEAETPKVPEGLQKAIETAFAEEIASNTAPGMAKCRAFVEREGCSKTAKDVCDRVRTIVRKKLGQKR